MKKIKKILLAFAPLTAIAIATPIVLTSCSNTPSNGNNNGAGDNNNDAVKPSFEKDETNSDKFALANDSDAQGILNKYKEAKGSVAADKVLDEGLANFPKKDSKTIASDVLQMWSNNNWFKIKNEAKDEKVKETFISNLNIKTASVDATSEKASFDVEYKNAFTDTNGKTYEATQLLKGDNIDVDATTKIDIPKEIPGNSYKIDGKDQSLTPATLLETPTDPKTNLENVLKQTKVSLDAKEVFKTYITNHNIKHAEEEENKPAAPEGIWSDSIETLDSGKIDIKQNKTQIDVFLDKFSDADSWYGLKKTSTIEDVKKAIYATKDGVNNLTDTFKNLINGKDSFTLATVAEKVSGKVLGFDITLKKDSNDSSPKMLKINVKTV